MPERLDPEMSASISAMIRRLKDELGTTAIAVTHSTSCAKTIGDELAVFEHGRILLSGPPAEVLAKHDENYMPKEVADALKKSGHWKQMEKAKQDGKKPGAAY